MFLISSIAICFFINLILDLKYFSKKSKKPEIHDLAVATNDEIMGQIEIIGSKINDIFKILKNDNNKNDISEIQTYLKALINEISVLKKESEKNANLEGDLSNKLVTMTGELGNIKNNLKELAENISNLSNNNYNKYKEELEPEIDSESNGSKKSNNEEEIDHDFNPGEIELEETSIQNLVENTNPSDNKEGITIDDFTEDNNNIETDIEEEEIEEDEDGIRNVSEKDDKESTTETVDIDNIAQKDENEPESEEVESYNSQEVDENEEDLSSKELENESSENKDEDEEDNQDESDNTTEISIEAEEENKSNEEISKEDNNKEEDLATKIKKLKEKLNSE